MEQIFKKLPYDKLVGTSPFLFLSWASAISLVLFLLAFFTIFDKAETKIENLSKLKYNAENTVQRSVKIIASKDVVDRKLNLVLGELTMKKKQLPNRNAINNIFEKVTMIGKKRDVNVTSFAVVGGEVKDFYKKVVLHFKFIGGFWNVMDMFVMLKGMRQIVDISNIIFNAKSNKDRTVVVSTITATIYVYDDVVIGLNKGT
jgi:Tfp pilus assembly protein PilO